MLQKGLQHQTNKITLGLIGLVFEKTFRKTLQPLWSLRPIKPLIPSGKRQESSSKSQTNRQTEKVSDE